MKLNYAFKVAALFLPAAFTTAAYAQSSSDKAILQSPPAQINIDGNLKDWGDSLRYHNEEQKLNFSLANDHENLYMAIRINDHSEQRRVLLAGLTLGINTKGKKKESYSLTFPVAEPGTSPFAGMARDNGNAGQRDLEGNTEAPSRDEMLKAHLTKLRYMKVTGFKDVESEMITTSNTYGFKAALNYDADGYLVYEAAIPLKLFSADELYKNEWAFDFKINGITRPEGGHGGAMAGGGGMGEGMRGGGMGRGGMGGGMGRGGMGGGGRRGGGMGRGANDGGSTGPDRTELAKSVDFWEKFYLSKS